MVFPSSFKGRNIGVLTKKLRTAYLDIETSYQGEITVVGIYYPPDELIQLVGDEIHRTNLVRALDSAEKVCTYNGSRFDLPVIRLKTGLDVSMLWLHCDLMLDCWRQGLRGGLKRVEEVLGIPRQTAGMDGRDALRLWEIYRTQGDEEALRLLLQYNRDDVVNLAILDNKLREMSSLASSNE